MCKRERVLQAMGKIMPECIQRNYPLKQLSRFGTGGSAAYFARVCTRTELKDCLAFASDRAVPFYILGRGSNCLISDEDFNGLVLKLAGDFCYIRFEKEQRRITAGAGASLMKLGSRIAAEGYSGMAYMGVIPGTVGGAVRNNAGTKQSSIQHHFARGLIYAAADGSIREVQHSDMAFSYRNSSLVQSKNIVLEATFTLPQSESLQQRTALSEIRTLREYRRRTNPKHRRTFGSTFKNPQGADCTAGWYLEQAGMKGMCIGGARVADEHANWIINAGTARSHDVLSLIAVAQQRVYEQFGITLEREVVLLPEDINTWS